MSDQSAAAPITLWLTDRTRHETSVGRCPRRRYLSNHFGPTGYGITSRSESLPLATGLSVHEAMEHLCRILQKENRLPTAEETRAIVAQVRGSYERKVDARGFRGILAGPLTDETIKEQSALISGLVWTLRLKFLPWLHESYRIVSLEEERLHFLSCTCAAGPLEPAQHIARGCEGIAYMLRRDILAERRGASTLAYFEIKTTGWESDAWAEQWETKPQLALGTLDVDKQFPGKEVTELYILGVGKGRRARDKYETVAEGEPTRKKQQSPLCYGYCRPGNPPLLADDWLPGYEWVNQDGETKRASRQHKRRGVWELAESDWPTWRAYRAQDPSMPPEEFWVRWLPTSVLDKVCFLVGPMNRQDQQLASLRESIRADEEKWQAVLWELYEAQHAGIVPACTCAHGEGAVQHLSGCASLQRRPLAWADPAFQSLLDRLIPCAWTCRPFGREHQCEFVPICHRHEGWQDPLLGGKFVPRRPHHAPELQQAIARGLLIEQTEDAIEEEER